MTVQEVIDRLQKIEDKTLPVVIDCNHCGQSMEMAEPTIFVVLGKKK